MQSNVLRKLFSDPKSLGRWCVLGFALIGSQVSAQTVTAPDSAFQRFVSSVTGVGKQTVSFSSSGNPVLAPGVPTLSTATGQAVATRTGSLALPSGVRLPVTAAARIPPAAAAKLLSKGLKLLPILGTGIALYEMAQELGFDVVSAPDGTRSLTTIRNVYITCLTGGPCMPEAQITPLTVAAMGGTIHGCTWGPTPNPALRRQTCYMNDSNAPIAWEYELSSVSSEGGPATYQDFEDAIAAKSGWPTSSKVSQALVDAADLTGETIPTEGPKVTGPASVAGPVEVSTKPISNGTKETTKSTQYDCTYVDGATVLEGGSVACTEKVTTTEKDTVTDPQTQQTTQTTTQTEAVTKPAETPKPDPVDPCIENPTRNGCRKDEFDVPTDVVPKSTQTVTWAAENLGLGSGQCIAPVVLTNRLGTQTISFQPYCDAITTWVKPLVLAFSLLAAFFIVAPIKQEGV